MKPPRDPRPSEAPEFYAKPEADPNACPKCGSRKLAGLYAAFWVELKPDGDPKDQWRDYESNTELTHQRQCSDCGHEFEI